MAGYRFAWERRNDGLPYVERLERIPAGQSCTRAGYWFTPAQANSRRYFVQGEIMPRFDQSDWGETLWYWSAEG